MLGKIISGVIFFQPLIFIPAIIKTKLTTEPTKICGCFKKNGIEAARTEMLREMGMVYKQLEQSGIYMPVVEAYCRYRKPVKYDELVRVRTALGDISRSKIRLDYEVQGEKDETVRVEGYTVHCFMDESGKPRRASQELLSFFQNMGES